MQDTKKPLIDEALVGNTSKNGSNEILGLKTRIERFETAKSNQTKILNYFRHSTNPHPKGIIEKLKDDIGGCGNYLVFKEYYTVGAVRLGKASFCKKHFLCQLCAIRRGAKQVESHMRKLESIQAEKPTLRPYLLTYTVKNGKDLKERFEHLRSSLNRLRDKRRNHLKKGTPCEFGKALGGVYSIELTKSKKGWHPHVHMVVLLDPNNPMDFPMDAPKKHTEEEWALVSPKDKKLEKQKWIEFNLRKRDSALSREWKKITKDSDIVDIRPIDGDPAMGFVEVFKYALKFSDLTPEDNVNAYFELLNSSGSMPHFTGSFGLLHGVKAPDSLLDETFDDLPYLELFYTYTKAGYSLTSTIKKKSDNDQLREIEENSPLDEVKEGNGIEVQKVKHLTIKVLLANEKLRIKNEKELFGRELAHDGKGNVVFDDNGNMVDSLPIMTLEENMFNAIDTCTKKYIDEDGERVFFDKYGEIIVTV